MAIADQIAAAAQAQGVDPSLAIEVANAESSLNPNVSDGSSGEIGLFQVMPTTGAQLGYSVDQLRDPNQNIQAGVTYLRQLIAQFGDPAKAVAAYNCGPGCVSNAIGLYGANWMVGVPSSTQSYVQKILGAQSAYTPSFNPAGAPFPAPTSVLNIPAAVPAAQNFSGAPSPGASMWSSLAVAAAVILGIGFVLSES